MERGDVLSNKVALARAIIAAVQAVPGVAEVSHAAIGGVATYGGGERVPGVAVSVRDDGSVDIEVHVCAVYTDSLVLGELAASIRKAIRHTVEAARGRAPGRIDVVFDDMRIDPDHS